MKIGTRSVLYGAHCFAYHGFAVALAWWRLYRWAPAFEGARWPAILDPRAWLVFFVHDLGYIGRPNMDGPEGEIHPFPGARLVTKVCTFPRGISIANHKYIPSICTGIGETGEHVVEGGHHLCPWGLFALLHSRYLAKALSNFPATHNIQPSRLCAADKLALSFTPWWLYLPGVILSGEIHEYMDEAARRGKNLGISVASRREWFESMRSYCARWAYEHADGRRDTWTGHRGAGELDQPKG